jgi:hypothetical protein
LGKKIKEIYFNKIEDQAVYLETLTTVLKSINEYTSIQMTDFNSHAKFYSSYVSKFKNLKLDPPPKTPNYIWDKDVDGIEEGLQRFLKLKEITLTSSHQRHKSGNHSNLSSNVSAMMEIHRKGSLVEDDLLRPSMHKSKENRPIDAKRFKF